MTVPVIDPQERRAALAKAAAVRKERAEVKQALKSGKISLREVLDTDTLAVRKMPVRALLESLPAVGKARADRLLAELEISTSRRVRGLGVQQRERLLERCAPGA
ncbi:integration host factor [Embleya scabrispora]|uniref:Integration host factor n=1 Tax=Embleya scabrispora TaxID=159449 RepID=A0A1T3NJ45_9ACTN|nr:integration host factor, actinobacterial type [Embleya scabrispora]OPC76621.1 integration host factor [Embleya scabrispora]